MKRFLLVLIYQISLFLFVNHIYCADTNSLQAQQVQGIAQNIANVTQIGQTGLQDITTLSDLSYSMYGRLKGAKANVETIDLKNAQLASIAFGGYTFIANPFNISKGVSEKILSDLYNLDVAGKLNTIMVAFIGYQRIRNNGISTDIPLLTLDNVDYFKLYVFTNPPYFNHLAFSKVIPLEHYYSTTQQDFVTPNFNSSSGVQNLNIIVNGQNVSNNAYPCFVEINNISGLSVPTRLLPYKDIVASLNVNEISEVTISYQEIDSLEIILGQSAFSCSQNSFNHSTTIGRDGIAANISSDIAPYLQEGMQFLLVAVDTHDDILSTLSDPNNQIDHYILYILNQTVDFNNQPVNNVIKGIYIDPSWVTPATSFGVVQDSNAITVKINGLTLAQGNYPLLINCVNNSGAEIPTSFAKKIILTGTQTLTALKFVINDSNGQQIISFGSDKKEVNTAYLNMLDTLNTAFAGYTILVNVVQPQNNTPNNTQNDTQTNTIIELYGQQNSTSPRVPIGSFSLPITFKSCSLEYMTSSTSSLESSIISSGNFGIQIQLAGVVQTLTYSTFKKIDFYDALKAVLSAQATFDQEIAASYPAQQNVIPGWYNPTTKLYQHQGFSLQLEQMQTGSGYFFVQDSSGISSKFQNQVGVAALDAQSLLLKSLQKNIVEGGECKIVLLAFEQNNNAPGNYIPDITKTILPAYFGLFLFDQDGNRLRHSPVFFNMNNFIGQNNYQLKSINSNTFVFNGLGLQNSMKLTYPFGLKIQWNFPGVQPKPKPTPPTRLPIPKSANIPMVISIIQDSSLTELGYIVSSQSAPVNFDSDFLNTITSSLTNINDTVKVKISGSRATVYGKNNQILTKISLDNIKNVQSIKNITYTISDGSQKTQKNLPISFIKGYKDIWLELKVIKPAPPAAPLLYSALTTLTLPELKSALQKIGVTLSSTTIPVTNWANPYLQHQTVPGWWVSQNGEEVLQGSGWTMKLQQMDGGDFYAFLEDPAHLDIPKLFQKKFRYAIGIVLSNAGVAAVLDKNAIEGTIIWTPPFGGRKPIISGSCSMVLLGFDAKNNYVHDIIATPPTNFGLFMFDTHGNPLDINPQTNNSGILFPAMNYVGLGAYTLQANAQGPAIFEIGGLGLSGTIAATYPSAIQINWVYDTY